MKRPALRILQKKKENQVKPFTGDRAIENCRIRLISLRYLPPMSTDYLDHDEIDASKVFRQSASDLISVKDLDMVLERFGYSKNDRIDRRELCMMYGTVKKNMEEEIGRLAHTSQYEDAKEMRQRLTKLRNEFDNLQTNAIKSSHNDQTKQIEKASHIIEKSLKTELKSQESNVNEYCKVIEKNQQKYHNIENENLESEISRMPIPRVKYSKRTQELLRAEHELIRLNQYDDARKVRHMLEKILPAEEKAFYEMHNSTIELKRRKLKLKHEEDDVRLSEKLKNIQWTELRRRENTLKVCKLRLSIHEEDMKHAHVQESRLKPEMSVKPSALWQKRENFNVTAAALRGQQLLNLANGKRETSQVFAASLVDRHNLGEPLQDTIQMNY